MTDGVGHIYLETHHWDETVAFWTALGFKLVDATDHGSGRLDPPHGEGPYLYIAEVAPDRTPTSQIYLRVAPGVELAAPPGVPTSGLPVDSHWGTRFLQVRDPDGRVVALEQPV